MEIRYIRNQMTKKNEQIANNLIRKFCAKHNIHINKLIIDFRKTVNEYTTDGLFGGFLDLYDFKTKTMYYAPKYFIDFDEFHNPLNVAHLTMHELTHCKQIQEGKMKIITPNKLKWNGKVYDRAPFNYDFFNKLHDMSGAIAEEYHSLTLPWEKEAYALPEKFMGKPLHEVYRPS